MRDPQYGEAVCQNLDRCKIQTIRCGRVQDLNAWLESWKNRARECRRDPKPALKVCREGRYFNRERKWANNYYPQWNYAQERFHACRRRRSGLVSPGSGIMRFSYSHHILMVQRANACSVRELRANLPNDDFTQLFVPPWACQIVEIAHSDAI